MRLPAPKMCAIQSGAGWGQASRPCSGQDRTVARAARCDGACPGPPLPSALSSPARMHMHMHMHRGGPFTTPDVHLFSWSFLPHAIVHPFGWIGPYGGFSPTRSGQPGEDDFFLPCDGTPQGPSSSASWTERHSGDNLGSAKSWGIWDLQAEGWLSRAWLLPATTSTAHERPTIGDFWPMAA
jgi:hypothetical protein